MRCRLPSFFLRAVSGRPRASLAVGMGMAALALGSACTSTRADEKGAFAFPETFSAQQLVHVELESRNQDFVALVRRDRDALSVVLMEPFFLSPIVEISRGGGNPLRVDWRMEPPSGTRKGLVAKFMDSLVDLYVRGEWRRPDPRREDESGAPDFTLERFHYHAGIRGLSKSGGCVFPSLIEMRPSRGPARAILARTESVECGPMNGTP